MKFFMYFQNLLIALEMTKTGWKWTVVARIDIR